MELINVKKIVLHILDSALHMPILSKNEHPYNEEVNKFVEKHLEKIIKDDNLKESSFIGEFNIIKDLCKKIKDDEANLNSITCEMAKKLFTIMQKNVAIPSADLLFCLFQLDNIQYLGILKFNYKHSFIHYVETKEGRTVNYIIKQKTTLPSENQKIEECALINLNDFSIKLLEKKYEINGEKLFYFSQMFLKCATQISTNEKIKIFSKATEKFSKKYFEEDYTKPVEIRKAVAESIEETDTINVVNLAENIFRKNPELKREYIQEIENAGLKEKTIPVTKKIAEKRFKTQKIKTDTGIEINLPIEYYGNKDKIEFINNPDGTISIVIKNITKISDK